jgi:very-short-patch-repair endonuclease
MICKYCEVETNLFGRAHSNHVGWCILNPKREERAKALIKTREHRKGKPGSNQYTKAKKEGHKVEVTAKTREKLSKAAKGKLHSEESKKKLSTSRKRWLQDNPGLHPWKRHEKFKSIPCEELKRRLRELGLEFKEEYEPLLERHFSVDIAFPAIKLAVEVNGEQHYNRDGTLRKYYKERHDLIVKAGWCVIELHYTRCYSQEVIEEIVFASRAGCPTEPSNLSTPGSTPG